MTNARSEVVLVLIDNRFGGLHFTVGRRFQYVEVNDENLVFRVKKNFMGPRAIDILWAKHVTFGITRISLYSTLVCSIPAERPLLFHLYTAGFHSEFRDCHAEPAPSTSGIRLSSHPGRRLCPLLADLWGIVSRKSRR